MSPDRSKERRIGRPPAGAREGERVKDYPQLSIRLPEDAKAKLQALSQVSARPQWRLISDAIDYYLEGQPESEPRLVEELMGRLPSRQKAKEQPSNPGRQKAPPHL